MRSKRGEKGGDMQGAAGKGKKVNRKQFLGHFFLSVAGSTLLAPAIGGAKYLGRAWATG